jgi:hypothetical protein
MIASGIGNNRQWISAFRFGEAIDKFCQPLTKIQNPQGNKGGSGRTA